MKEMIKRIREERGGFTLAELLIVVAIVLVLVAIAVPVFTGALDNANRSVARADIHAVKSAAGAAYLLNDETGTQYYEETIQNDGTMSDVAKSGETTETTEEDILDEIWRAHRSESSC